MSELLIRQISIAIGAGSIVLAILYALSRVVLWLVDYSPNLQYVVIAILAIIYFVMTFKTVKLYVKE